MTKETIHGNEAVEWVNIREPDYGAVTGDITGSAQTVVCPVDGANGAAVSYSGTYAGVTLLFEASYDGGTNFLGIYAQNNGGAAPVTTTGSKTNSLEAWSVFCPGATHVRVRSTTYTSGTMSVRVTPIVLSQPAGQSVWIAGPWSGVGQVAPSATTSSTGATMHSLVAAATTNATSVKASAGKLYSLVAGNISAGAKYLKLYNKASAPTVGTDTPVMTIPIPAGSAVSLDLGAVGVAFSAGIAYAITGAGAVSDTTAVAAGDVVVNLGYI